MRPEQSLKQADTPQRKRESQKLKNSVDGGNTFEAVTRLWMNTKQKGLNQKICDTKPCTFGTGHVFPLIGALPITEITIPIVVRVIDKLADRGTIETAKRMKGLISQVFRFASTRGLCASITPPPILRGILPQQEKEAPCLIADCRNPCPFTGHRCKEVRL